MSAHGRPVAATWSPPGSVLTAEPIRRVAPGQSVVLYRGDAVVGGGTAVAGPPDGAFQSHLVGIVGIVTDGRKPNRTPDDRRPGGRRPSGRRPRRRPRPGPKSCAS